MNNAEIEQLKLLVEEKYGKGLNTTTDFESFSVDLHYKAQLDLSASTLKRLWGYVSDSHKPRVGTLDVLARYLGHADYRAFVRWLKTSTRFNSSFIHADQLVSNALVVGDEVEIGWNPNRLIRLRYLGESLYEVVAADNSKLCVGDRFLTGCFLKGQPLFLPYLIRRGERTEPFVAGRNGGLSILKVFKHSKA